MESVNKAGHLMSLAALQHYDPYINKLLDVTGQVALYKFNSKASEWEKTDIEGTLFVYARSASPHHGFTIMNRLSTENLVEPINKDLEFQLQDPFLLYRNASLGIYSIWFYDKADCQRIAQLMVQIVKQEALRAQHTSPDRGRTNGCVETRPLDILELLSKAKEEYNRNQSNETDLQVNPDVAQTSDPIKVENTKQSMTAAQQEKPTHSVVKQITVEELFGSSLPKDPAPPVPPGHNHSEPTPGESFLQRLTYGPPPLPLEPLLTPCLTADPGGPGLVPLLQAGGSRDPQHSVSPRLMAPSGTENVPALIGPRGQTGPQAAPQYINPVQGEGHGIPKPAPVPGFIPSTLVTPQSFRDPTPKAPVAFTSTAPAQTKEADTFAQPQAQGLVKTIPKTGLGVPGLEALLLSPSAFQQSAAKVPELQRHPAPPASPPSTLGSAELPPALYNKTQLQDVLIHLIKNDAHFLTAIHEAYLQSLSKDLNNVKL
ncbi:mRNA-decapping enzyme 1A isoform X1 [Astyanax mexicanus]|uniref:5'-(N(7)-methylguanosine 5'-triphospho)-[mRNA] hydrolase n=1 Tax=Astyanax mexicanus TaxID=7994 RepID=A0A8T2LJW8_ASTMX|nr:mRNA-decapping enzyme 1A isoform X1 [Astyanax mexicanus]